MVAGGREAGELALAGLIAWPIGFIVMNWWLQGFAYRVGQPPWTLSADTPVP